MKSRRRRRKRRKRRRRRRRRRMKSRRRRMKSRRVPAHLQLPQPASTTTRGRCGAGALL